jgi:hypothetical protein
MYVNGRTRWRLFENRAVRSIFGPETGHRNFII